MKQKNTATKNILGWLNLYKPEGMSSAHAVARVKRIFNAKKAGHAGTLDPLAEGILPIAFGKATKTVSYFMDAQKTYIFELTFGEQTDTDDAEGTVIKKSSLVPTQEQLINVLPKFTGTIEQIPPQFSAIKINVVRSYKQDSAGIAIEMPKRTVTIYSLKINSFSPSHATLQAIVSKGTYIRSLARDIGEQLGCYAYISYLQRTAVGNFTKENSVPFDELENLSNDLQALEQLLISIEDIKH